MHGVQVISRSVATIQFLWGDCQSGNKCQNFCYTHFFTAASCQSNKLDPEMTFKLTDTQMLKEPVIAKHETSTGNAQQLMQV